MLLMALQANKGFDLKSQEVGLVPEEGSLGIANKRPRMTAQTSLGRTTLVAIVATQDRLIPYYAPNSSIKHSKSDSKDRSQEIL
jgi:hypothetical protein